MLARRHGARRRRGDRMGLIRGYSLIMTLALALATSAIAQTVPVIGRLHPGSGTDPAQVAFRQAFHDSMRALGHVEGRTYRFDVRYAEGDPARLVSLAASLARDKVDVIVAASSQAARAAKQATQTIPIVMAMSGPDPVGDGLVKSLARPGGNVTGMTGQVDETPVKQLELLRELAPGLGGVLVLFNPEVANRPGAALAAAAAQLGLRLHPVEITRADQIDAAFSSLDAGGAWGVLAYADAAVLDRIRARIAALALQHRSPSAHSFRMGVEAGGLFSYSVDLMEMHRRSAVFVDRILKGANPAELPIERPTKFEMVVNLRTARALGLEVPQSILLRADEVIE
jgi:putative tryptophan/tyrosine transport system substrate-binding protein